MGHKKGQVALFMIAAVLVMAAGSLYFFYSKKPEKITGKNEFDEVQIFIETCLKNAAEDGIYFIPLQGGYYEAPENSLPFAFIQIPYYWSHGEENVPKKEIIEQELSKFVQDSMEFCISNFTSLKEIGYSIEYSRPSIVSKIADRNVIIRAEFPVKILTESGIKEFKDFNSVIDINLKEKYDYANQIIEEQKKDANSIPLGFMAEQAYSNNFTFEYIYLGNGDVVYSLIFNESFGNTLVFAFAAKYNWSNQTPSQSISIKPVPEFNLTAPKVINYKVEASGENLTFYDYTGLFDIGQKTGQINFDAFDVSNGEYDVLIKAADGKGNEAFTIMKISINYNNKLPIIEPVGNLTAYVGKEFSYKVKASDPANKFLFFLDDTSLFGINVNTGDIKFTPQYSGNYTIKIVATNEAGSSYEYFNLEVR